MTSRLTFQVPHTYWLRDPETGRKKRIPSVSSLKNTLHQFDNDDWRMGKAAEAVTNIWDELARSAPTTRPAMIKAAAMKLLKQPMEFGTAVHHYAEQLWTGEAVEVPEEYATYVRTIADWWDTNRVTLTAAEHMCWADDNDLGAGPVGGRFDLLIKHPERGIGLLDLKTWMPSSSGSPQPGAWAFQLTAYAGMDYMVLPLTDEDVPFPVVDWCGTLHVGPGGAVLYTLSDKDRRIAADQVECARALKTLPKPTMTQAS